MDESDLDWVLRARNSQLVRNMSGSSKRITKHEHRIWFDCSVSSWKLVFTEKDEPKGVVIYDKVSQYWSFYLVPSASKHGGLGRLMLSTFLVYAKKRGLKKIKARVSIKNHVSINLHKDMRFDWAGTDDPEHIFIKEL